MAATYFPLSATRMRRVRIIFYFVTLLLIIYGVRGLWRTLPDIGQPFGGIPITWNMHDGYTIGVEVPWNWPGPQRGLRGNDRVIRIDGQDPYYFLKDAFPGKGVGDAINYEIERDGQHFQATVPVSIFSFGRFFEIYGFWFLAGVACALAGALFVHTAMDEARLVLATTFLAIAAAFFFHGYTACVHSYCFGWESRSALVWVYSYPTIGVLLFLFAILFPTPPLWLVQHPRLRFLPLMWALFLGTVYFMTNYRFDSASADAMVLDVVLATVSIGGIAVTLRPFWSYSHSDPEERGWTIRLGSVWAIGVVLLLGVGILPFIAKGGTMILTEVLLPLCMVYPLAFAYAVYNVDLIEQLERQIQVKEQIADELSELRGIRERTLHELADELHDTIVPEARGLQFMEIALSRRLQKYLTPKHISDLGFLKQTLQNIYGDSRRIMEDAKPVNFYEEGLTLPIQRLIAQADAAGWWESGIQLTIAPCTNCLAADAAEDVYWIVREALINCREREGVKRVAVRMERQDHALLLSIAEEGNGSMTGYDTGQRLNVFGAQLGARNMRLRVERIHAKLNVVDSAQGTVLVLTIPV